MELGTPPPPPPPYGSGDRRAVHVTHPAAGSYALRAEACAMRGAVLQAGPVVGLFRGQPQDHVDPILWIVANSEIAPPK